MPCPEQSRLVYVMGPSGAGKDTLLHHARNHPDAGGTVFAQRYITRPLPEKAEEGSETHIFLAEADFIARKRAGFFALHWQSHGLRYGISTAIDAELGQGRTVVVNGSREYLPEALRRYPAMLPVLVHARPEILRERLRRRGREQGAAVEERLQGASLAVSLPCVRIDNSGPLEHALSILLTLLQNGPVHPDSLENMKPE